jgi:hypothetical protein
MTLPHGRAAWAIYALIVVILTTSSAAPFLQLGSGTPRVSGDDLRATAIYFATWMPLLAIAAWIVVSLRGWALWVTHVLLVLVIPLSHTVVFNLANAAWAGDDIRIATLQSPGFQVLTLLGTLQYLVLLAVVIAIASGRAADRDRSRTIALELEQSVLNEQLAAARLESLSAQLRPHFLFNTLNSISVLVTADPPAAQAMIRQLSALLRASLGHTRPIVPLSEEVRLLESYVGIQKMRLGERLTMHLAIDPSASDCDVPALLLQPLVENAVEHGIAENGSTGSIEVTATRSHDRLRIHIADDGRGRRSDLDVPVREHAGIGLSNTSERLVRLYGEAHRFDVSYPPAGGCVVTIEIPARISSRTGTA